MRECSRRWPGGRRGSAFGVRRSGFSFCVLWFWVLWFWFWVLWFWFWFSFVLLTSNFSLVTSASGASGMPRSFAVRARDGGGVASHITVVTTLISITTDAMLCQRKIV